MATATGARWPVLLLLLLLSFAWLTRPSRGASNDAVKATTIGDDLGERLRRKLDESAGLKSLVYTGFNSTSSLAYNASTDFDPMGMGQLYNVTNAFIDFLHPKQAFPEGLIRFEEDGELVLADPASEWRELLTHYGALGAVAFAGLLLAALLPCVGLFFCCCRCAGRCGARSAPFDKKHDHCRKVVLSFLLIGCATVLLFGVVCAFATNEYMQEGTRELPRAAATSLRDLRTYLQATKSQIETLLKFNYDELELALNSILRASGQIVTEQLAESSHAVSLMSLNDIVAGLSPIRKDLKMMTDITRELRNNASHLEILVRKVRNNLLQTLSSCDTQQCKDLMNKYRIGEMTVKVDFDKLPDLTVNHVLNNISQLMDGNIVAEVRKGMEEFMNIQKEIQQAVNQTIPVVSASIRRAGDSLAGVSNNIVQMVDRLSMDIDKNYLPQLDYAKRHIDQYSHYRYYLGLSISSILLTVFSCLTFGLFCGVCGKRPDGYDDDCCNKGSGARFLMMAVWIIFLLTSVLLVVTIAHMVTGILAERVVCEPLKHPEDNHVFELLDRFVNVKQMLYPKNVNADIDIAHMVTACHKNETIYKVLKLQYIVDVESLRGFIDRYDINQTIHQLEQKISLSHDYRIISEAAREKLNALAQSGLSDIKFYQFTDNLKDNITSINLEQLAGKLREVALKLPNGYDEVKEDLLKNAYDLEGYHRDIVVPMSNLSNRLSDSATELQEHIKFNHTSMAEAILSLVDQVDKAQVFISTSGPSHVKTLAQEFGKAFIFQVNNYLDYVINSTLTKVGKCGPVSHAYNATVVASCNKILDPFNGFWASVGWSLLLFIPTIVLCVKLSVLYQKSDPYPGPLVEATPDKKYVAHNRHHHHLHHHGSTAYIEGYLDGTAISYTDRERIADAHQGTSHDSRYSDLAPKNWDFPNGGPPRYQPAAVAPPLSTEYERPPPYYYPGPGDRN
ncbi:prominin-like protein isoform X2 [Trichogramma pretiosum]|uniref:prominin-like protein isoform X2 n=1 Tax=Trichogramma pretiosum TaxID=7493 RepID=UPI0006C9D213|nr:prominin-like protein isoform X2 [Trichogramma pretiosum]